MSPGFGENVNMGGNELPPTIEQASAYVREAFFPLIHKASQQWPPKEILKLDNGVTLLDIDTLVDSDARDTFAIDDILPQIVIDSTDNSQLPKAFYGFSKEGILHELSDGTTRFKDHPVLGTCTVIRHGGMATPADPETCLDILGKLIAGKPTV